MNLSNYYKILLFLLFIIITSLIIYLINQSSKEDDYLYNTDSVWIQPGKKGTKTDCLKNRTQCNPSDPNSCSQTCNNSEELSCINLDLFNSKNNEKGKKINGGGYVCLPQIKNNCDLDKGGIYAWTGYSEVDTADWSCVCLYPDRFSGPECSQQTPNFCTGGTIDTSKLSKNKIPDDSICNCPSGTTKVINEDSNLPFCADNKLLGNLVKSPSWKLIYYNPKSDPQNADFSLWANNIIDELFYSNYITIDKDTLSKVYAGIETLLSTKKINNLNLDIAKQICSLSNQIDPSLCLNGEPVNFPNQQDILTTISTFYDNTELMS